MAKKSSRPPWLAITVTGSASFGVANLRSDLCKGFLCSGMKSSILTEVKVALMRPPRLVGLWMEYQNRRGSPLDRQFCLLQISH